MTKKLIRLTESDLCNIINESVNKIKENIEAWQSENDKLYNEAINELSDYILSMHEPDELIEDPDIIEREVLDEWQYVLNDQLIDAIYDKIDVNKITGKNKYGGGGFETVRQLQIDVKDNVLSILEKNKQ